MPKNKKRAQRPISEDPLDRKLGVRTPDGVLPTDSAYLSLHEFLVALSLNSCAHVDQRVPLPSFELPTDENVDSSVGIQIWMNALCRLHLNALQPEVFANPLAFEACLQNFFVQLLGIHRQMAQELAFRQPVGPIQ